MTSDQDNTVKSLEDEAAASAEYFADKIFNSYFSAVSVDGRNIGKMLIFAKLSLGHGGFCEWVSERLPFSRQTACHYMRVYRESEELADNNPEIDF